MDFVGSGAHHTCYRCYFQHHPFAISLVVTDLGSAQHGAGAVVAVACAVDVPAGFRARAEYLGGMRVRN